MNPEPLVPARIEPSASAWSIVLEAIISDKYKEMKETKHDVVVQTLLENAEFADKDAWLIALDTRSIPEKMRANLDSDQILSFLARMTRQASHRALNEPAFALLVDTVAVDFCPPGIVAGLPSEMKDVMTSIMSISRNADIKTTTDLIAYYRQILSQPETGPKESKVAAMCLNVLVTSLASPVSTKRIMEILHNCRAHVSRKEDGTAVADLEVHVPTVRFDSDEVYEAWNRTLKELAAIPLDSSVNMGQDLITFLVNALTGAGATPSGRPTTKRKL